MNPHDHFSERRGGGQTGPGWPLNSAAGPLDYDNNLTRGLVDDSLLFVILHL